MPDLARQIAELIEEMHAQVEADAAGLELRVPPRRGGHDAVGRPPQAGIADQQHLQRAQRTGAESGLQMPGARRVAKAFEDAEGEPGRLGGRAHPPAGLDADSQWLLREQVLAVREGR
jgi:hypothetical protein